MQHTKPTNLMLNICKIGEKREQSESDEWIAAAPLSGRKITVERVENSASASRLVHNTPVAADKAVSSVIASARRRRGRSDQHDTAKPATEAQGDEDTNPQDGKINVPTLPAAAAVSSRLPAVASTRDGDRGNTHDQDQSSPPSWAGQTTSSKRKDRRNFFMLSGSSFTPRGNKEGDEELAGQTPNHQRGVNRPAPVVSSAMAQGWLTPRAKERQEKAISKRRQHHTNNPNAVPLDATCSDTMKNSTLSQSVAAVSALKTTLLGRDFYSLCEGNTVHTTSYMLPVAPPPVRESSATASARRQPAPPRPLLSKKRPTNSPQRSHDKTQERHSKQAAVGTSRQLEPWGQPYGQPQQKSQGSGSNSNVENDGLFIDDDDDEDGSTNDETVDIPTTSSATRNNPKSSRQKVPQQPPISAGPPVLCEKRSLQRHLNVPLGRMTVM